MHFDRAEDRLNPGGTCFWLIMRAMQDTIAKINTLLQRYRLKPQKSLGQNFLVDQAALKLVVAVAEIERDQTVLEIGPGLGSLTCLLAESARRVVCVELDRKIIPALREATRAYPNVEIIQGDILALDPDEWMPADSPDQPPDYLVVANIPYYITSALIRHLMETRYPPKRMVLTVQREVAERISANAGALSLLAISVQIYGRPRIAGYIPAGAFYPPPKVDSAVIRVDLYETPQIEKDRIPLFFRLVKAGFSQKRKTLRNALSGGMRWSAKTAEEKLLAAGIDPMRRAETLSLPEWRTLLAVAEASPPEDHQDPGKEA